MKKYKILTSIIMIVAVLAAIFAPGAMALDKPDITAKAAVLMEAKSGTVLYDKEGNARRSPASVTKLTTVLLAVEAYENGKIDLEKAVTAQDNIYFDLDWDGSTQNIQPGEIMSYKDLMYCALVASANEACNILAMEVAGSVDDFVKMMNERVTALGCNDTHYANTHGLTNESHYTTANDVCRIMREALNHPLMKDIMETVRYTVPATNMSEARKLRNTNELIDEDSYYYYPECKGGKTGTTEAAGHCLASYANDDSLQLISVILGADTYESEYGTVIERNFTETETLFDWGFSNYSYQKIITTADLITRVDVEMGSGADDVTVVPASDIIALVPNDVDLNAIEKTITIYSEQTGEPVTAPIAAGEELGSMSVYLGGIDYGTVKLVSNAKVDMAKSAYIRGEIKKTLNIPIVKTIIIVLIVMMLLYLVLAIRYSIVQSKRKKARREKQRARREVLRQRQLEEARQGIRVPTREEEMAQASARSARNELERTQQTIALDIEDYFKKK